MVTTSVKKILSLENDDVTSSLLRVVLLFLETASLQAAQFDPKSSAAYRGSIRGVREEFEQAPANSDLMVLAGKAIHTMEAYSRETERFIRNQALELTSIAALLIQTLIKTSNASATKIQDLRRIEKELQQTTQIEDIRILKSKLISAVSGIAKDPPRAEQPTGGDSVQAYVANQKTSQDQNASWPADEVTGLPALKTAEARIREILALGKTCYAFVLFLERMDTINKRFGFQIGDQILQSFSQATRERLLPTDELYRWRGPCFLALLDRNSGFETVRSDVSRIATARLEQAVETADRSILLSLSRAWTLIPVSPGVDAATITNQIDAFAAEQTRLATVPR